MSPNQIAVLRFLFENANSPNVLEAIEAVANGKYSAPETSLLRRAQAGDLFCYASISEIANSTTLKPACVRDQIKKLRVTGIIESEQLWKVFFIETANHVHKPADQFHPKPYILLMGGKCDLISVDEAESRRSNGGEYGEDVSPGANLYRILGTQIPLPDATLCKPAEQLTLPFPPNERTILAQRARIRYPDFEPKGKVLA